MVFEGHTLSVRVDPVWAKSGAVTREVVVRVPAVAVVAESDEGKLVMVRQFRWAVGEELYELPAGKVDPGEDPLMAARRELREETGFDAETWEFVHGFYPSPGYTSERIDMYYASSLKQKGTRLDPDEEIQVELWSREDVENQLRSGAVRNGIALSGLYWWLYAR